jgi:hypothetical protein
MSSVERTLTRRRLLETLGLAGSALLAGCSSSPASASAVASTSTASASSTTSGCAVTPEETAGPYPFKTTQIALPEDVTSAVYRTGVYASHGQRTTSNSSDMIFATARSTKWPRSAATRRAATRQR